MMKANYCWFGSSTVNRSTRKKCFSQFLNYMYASNYSIPYPKLVTCHLHIQSTVQVLRIITQIYMSINIPTVYQLTSSPRWYTVYFWFFYSIKCIGYMLFQPDVGNVLHTPSSLNRTSNALWSWCAWSWWRCLGLAFCRLPYNCVCSLVLLLSISTAWNHLVLLFTFCKILHPSIDFHTAHTPYNHKDKKKVIFSSICWCTL